MPRASTRTGSRYASSKILPIDCFCASLRRQWRKGKRARCSPPPLVLQRHRIKLQPVVDQPVAELAGDFGLQALDLLGLELDHLAGAQVDQVVVMGVGHLLVAGTAVAKIVAL